MGVRVFTFDWFFDQLGDLDWLGVILGTVLMVVLGAVWWGPLFGKQWSAARGVAYEMKPDPQKVIATVIYSFLFNIGLGYWAFDDFEHAVVMALVFGVLLILPVMYSAVVWAGENVKVFAIDAGYWLVAIILAGFLQGLVL